MKQMLTTIVLSVLTGMLMGCATPTWKANVLGVTASGDVPVEFIEADAGEAKLALHPPTVDTLGFSKEDAKSSFKWIAERPGWLVDLIKKIPEAVNRGE